MAVGQPVVNVCAVQNILRSRETRGVLMIVGLIWSVQRNPLSSPGMINVSAQMSAEGEDTFTKLTLTTGMKSIKCFQSAHCSYCSHLTHN